MSQHLKMRKSLVGSTNATFSPKSVYSKCLELTDSKKESPCKLLTKWALNTLNLNIIM